MPPAAAVAGSGHREATSGGTTRHCSSVIDESVRDAAICTTIPPPAQTSAGARSMGSGVACSPTGATALIRRNARPPMRRAGRSITIAVPPSTTVHDASSSASSGPPAVTCVTRTVASFSIRIFPVSQGVIGRTCTCSNACRP